MSDYILLCTTVGTEEKALELARMAVGGGLAACVQLDQIRSVYRWKGQTEDEPEVRLTFKTTNERKAALLEAVRAAHPYELPELIILPIQDGYAPYLSWIRESVAD